MFLIGIAGGSGSGKTTFARKILKRVGLGDGAIRVATVGGIASSSTTADSPVALMHMDSYYLPEPPDHLCEDGSQNFDHPLAFDWALLKAQLKSLKAGKSIDAPVYDFKVSRRREEADRLGPCQAILLEGLYTLWDPEIRELLDLKVFLHVEADIRFIRRLHRDVRERGRSLDGIIRQYYDSVRPMHHQHLEPTQQYADLIVGEETDLAADVIAARVQQLLVSGEKASL